MFDIGVIGSGPAGYSAAIRAAQKGLKVVVFEKDKVGGTCLNKGCIPTKTMIKNADTITEIRNALNFGIEVDIKNIDEGKMNDKKNILVEKIRKSLTQLISSYGIEIVEGEAIIKSNNEISAAGNIYECKNIIIATGSKPNIFKFEGTYKKDFILTSDDILKMNKYPDNIMIVGSGAIGIEWTRIFSQLGKKVTLIELAENLIPQADIDVSVRIERIFKKNKIEYCKSTSIKNIDEKTVTLTNDKIYTPDAILLATGRSANLPQSDIEIKYSKFIDINGNYQTNHENIYAIGDINGLSMLAHSAIYQAICLVDYITENKQNSFDKKLVPAIIYGYPEVAWIGEKEQDLQEGTYKKVSVPIAALGKANTDGKTEGFIKILATEEKILGAHIISEEASAMIQEFAIAMANNMPPKAISKAIHGHPTYAEGIFEAIMSLSGEAIHLRKN
ncbi:MAG: dihydrolipoyl dehydrogenase [Candidatus Gastranaerophilales bacterium]|nr:dihydrolipoyl dehydrogenase [Candidatus Gastranaerophilales bacterium]